MWKHFQRQKEGDIDRDRKSERGDREKEKVCSRGKIFHSKFKTDLRILEIFFGESEEEKEVFLKNTKFRPFLSIKRWMFVGKSLNWESWPKMTKYPDDLKIREHLRNPYNFEFSKLPLYFVTLPNLFLWCFC